MQIPGYRIDALMLQTARSALYRGRAENDLAVVIKTPAHNVPTMREIARYQWAFDQAREADQRAVVRHLDLVRFGASVALVTEDFGGASLASLLVPTGFSLGRLLDCALAVATALGRLHASGIVHKDIKPDNIIVRADGSDLRLIDLDISTNLRREIVATVSLDQIEGTLAYMSPEQCGRVASPVDDRSDLYSLGVTLFQLATGRLPFVYDDPAELVYAHVARLAPTLREIRPALPPILSDIVNRLLAKNPDDRYASARGLAHDLACCISDLRRTGTVRAFDIGQADVATVLRVPDRLYGREADRQRLLNAFEDTRHGQRTLATVSGVSGIGKTALVNDASRGMTQAGGRFCSGKFDQFGADLPYLGILAALSDLLRQELAMPQAKLEVLRTALRQALGIHARLLTHVLPDLLTLIGPQPEVETVEPRDAERRLHLLVGQFIAVLATPGRPLVMFLDDLQWADLSSLQLLEALAADTGLAHLIIVAGYRSNEAGIGHPLHNTLDAWRSAASVSVDICLNPLQAADLEQLLADTLHVSPMDVQSLGAYINTVADGNPFVVQEYLRTLQTRGFFQFDEDRRAWAWDVARLPEFLLPDNVGALIADRLEGLPVHCLDLLDTASCVGSEFDLHTLASVHEISQSAAATGLSAAVRKGILLPLDAHYKTFESLDHWAVPALTLNELGTARYRFQHDKVRQTVHERLDAQRLAQRHLQIGRLLVQNLPAQELAHRVVEVFSHIVSGIALVHDEGERRHLLRIGLAAGRSAQHSLAFAGARRMLAAAAQLMAPSVWRDDYDTAFGIHMALAECAHALMLGDELETATALVIEHAQTVEHRSQAYGLRIRRRTVQNQYVEAVDIAVDVAASLGVVLPRKPHLAHVLWAVVQTLWAQGRRDPRDFDQLPEATDPAIRAVMPLLSEAASAAYFAEPNLLPLIGMAGTRLSLKYGVTPQSSNIFVVWALVLCGVLGRIENGYRFGELALKLGRRYGGLHESQARFVVDAFVAHWKDPLPDVTRKLYFNWASNRNNGDKESATYCAGVLHYTYFFAGGALDLHERYADSIRYLADGEETHVKDCHMAWVELFAALRKPQMPAELDGEWFQYTRQLPKFLQSNHTVQIAISSMAAAMLDHLAGRYERAEERFALAASHEDGIVGQVLVPGLAFFRALNAYRRLASGSADKRALKLARRLRRRLERWAVHAPSNLAHRVSLLAAEDAAVRGHSADAVLLLHRAYEQAAGGGILYQALAQQRLAGLLETQGVHQLSGAASLRASELFRGWGSPWLASANAAPAARHHRTTDSGASVASGVGALISSQFQSADLNSLLSAVASISREMDETILLERLMPALMQVAGADRSLLLLIDAAGKTWIEAEANLAQTINQRNRLEDFHTLSRSVVDRALRSPDSIIIHDASKDKMLENEPYARENSVAAILCVSIAVRGRTIGLLYLENHVTRNAFTTGRVQLTQALGVQTATAIENARLYNSTLAALDAQTVLTEANRRFVPGGFLTSFGRTSIVDVNLNEAFEREMNVLFVDLRGFSKLSAKLGPRGTIGLINRYLSHVQPGIAAHGGFVGQYYGDGILALFPNEPDDALRGAIAMCRGLEAYNRERGPDFPALRFGMGLHSGPVILGTIGDPDHFQCSVVGDSVNLASRMESLTKHFSAQLVLDAATRSRVVASDQFLLRPLGSAMLDGHAAARQVYECVACYPQALQDKIMANQAAYVEALAAYRAGAWNQALERFEFCLERCEQDRVVHSFAQRCRDRSLSGMAWDGIERPAKN